MKWHTDILGDDFEACTYQATGADGVERTATLVRHVPKGGTDRHGRTVPRLLPRRSILFLHGWSDYFFNVELAEFWTNKGFEFFALDMHNHGRSLQPDTHGGFVADLDDYDAEISKAIGHHRLPLAGGSRQAVADPDGPLDRRACRRPVGQPPSGGCRPAGP